MRTAGSELVYGLKDGKLIYTDEAENGLDCGCVCPSCGKPLIARQGKKNTHHFAHKGTNECEYVKQTNIHCMAEEIFLEEKEILLPSIIIDEGNTYSPIFQGGKAAIDSVELEKRISDFIPDIVLNINGATLLVEIYVTHAVDEEKKAKVIKAGNYFMIEIDLSEFVHEDMTKEQLREHLHDTERIHWIHNPIAFNATNEFESAKKQYPINPNMTIPSCPAKVPGEVVTFNDCENCIFFLGKADNSKVICNADFFKTHGKISWPPVFKRTGLFQGPPHRAITMRPRPIRPRRKWWL